MHAGFERDCEVLARQAMDLRIILEPDEATDRARPDIQWVDVERIISNHNLDSGIGDTYRETAAARVYISTKPRTSSPNS